MSGRKDKKKKIAEINTFGNVLQCYEFNNPVLHNEKNEVIECKGKWHEIFGNQNLIVVELACGKGDYTIALAQNNADKNFIGIDIKGPRIHTGAKKCIEENIANVRFARLKIENIPLNIVYEDEDVLVINKPSNMVVHPGVGNHTGTLLNGVAYHLLQQNPSLNEEELPRYGLVHRIDKNTTGLIVLAKNGMAAAHLAKQFFNHTVKRNYVALAWGNLEANEGTINTHIARHKQYRKMFDAYPDGEIGKNAITHYKVIERMNYVTLVSCQLETGRTHQIRVHMKFIGHTLFNDWEYGGDKILKGTIFTKYKQFVDNCFAICPRCALHAKTLGFIHPTTQKEMFFEAELPEDMKNVISKWRGYVGNKQLD